MKKTGGRKSRDTLPLRVKISTYTVHTDLYEQLCRILSDSLFPDCETWSGDSSMAPTTDEALLSAGKRKPSRMPRHLQLSPVKESLPLQPGPEDAAGPADNVSVSSGSVCDTTDSSGKQEQPHQLPVLDAASGNSNISGGGGGSSSSLPTDLQIIIKVENERLLMFVHFRDTNEEVKTTWKLIHVDLVEAVRTICIKVNQDLLLQDLHNTRSCNRLLEPESSEDAWRDSSSLSSSARNRSYEDEFELLEEAPAYLEANMNVRWVPGQFQCAEVWRTALALHPRLKMGQGPGGQSQGLQALKTTLSHNIIVNRSDMFVYMDDQKNVFYLKIHEQVHGYAQSVTVSRQTSLLTRNDEDSVSRTSSIGSSKQLKKTSGLIDELSSSGNNSRSNSVGESDRTRTGEDQIIIRVFGIEEPGKNVKEDLVAVLQKKLDDKVVEMISMMLKRNSRCKLTSDDVLFLQRPGCPPSSVLQFTVHVNAIQYLPAVAYYLRQNLIYSSGRSFQQSVCPRITKFN